MSFLYRKKLISSVYLTIDRSIESPNGKWNERKRLWIIFNHNRIRNSGKRKVRIHWNYYIFGRWFLLHVVVPFSCIVISEKQQWRIIRERGRETGHDFSRRDRDYDILPVYRLQIGTINSAFRSSLIILPTFIFALLFNSWTSISNELVFFSQSCIWWK